MDLKGPTHHHTIQEVSHLKQKGKQSYIVSTARTHLEVIKAVGPTFTTLVSTD